MFSKVFFFLVALQLTYIHAYEANTDADVSFCTINKPKIREQTLDKISSHTQGMYSMTPLNYNIQFFPVVELIQDNMVLIQIFHENNLTKIYGTKNYLDVPFALACILNKMQQSSSVQLKFKNAIFYDTALVNKEYLYDVITYYHSEFYEITIYPNNTALILSSIKKWMDKNTKGKRAENDEILIPGSSNFHTSAVNFSGCWESTKLVDEVLLFTLPVHNHHPRNRNRRSPQILQFPKLNFDNLAKTYVDTFSANETVGYYNSTRLGFEAIRIAFKGDEFAMTILLPYESKNLSIFRDFAFHDYLTVLNQVNENREKIHYVIPALNLDMVSINEKGTTMNAEGPTGCDSFYHHYIDYDLDYGYVGYKPFVVNRPYGIFIYHEKTKIVLWQGWIRDPTSEMFLPRKYLYNSNARG